MPQSVETLLREHRIETRRLLALTVDAEGHDLDILEGVPWQHISPRLLAWEASSTLPSPHKARSHQCRQLTNRTMQFIQRVEGSGAGYACGTAGRTGSPTRARRTWTMRSASAPPPAGTAAAVKNSSP